MMSKRVLLIVLLLFPAVAFAGSASGRVTSIFVANDSAVVLFKLDGELRDSPRCNESGRFAIQTAKKGGANVYRAILEAKARGYTVVVKGLNTCATNWKSEDVRNLEIH
jgi:hypothetical protein